MGIIARFVLVVSMTSDLSLTLFESSDVEDGRLRLDSSDMRLLGALVGDVVLVEGARRVYLIVQPAPVGDRNQRLAQVSPLTAKNIGYLTGQNVRLCAERTKMPVAELVTLSTEDDLDLLHLSARQKQIGFFWNKRIILVGDVLTLPTLGRDSLQVNVSSIQPQGVVQISHTTEFVIESRTKEASDLIRIGGLRDTYRLCQSLLQDSFIKMTGSCARSVMLSGPVGCGKSRLVARLAQSFGAELHVLDAYQLLDKALCANGLDLAAYISEISHRGRGILLLDHLEVLCETQENASVLSAAIYSVVGQICSLLDEVPTQPNLVVFGIDSGEFNPRLRAHQRFDVHIPVDAPNRWGRHEVLLLATQNAVAEEVDLEAIAFLTKGMTACNIVQMVKRAKMLSKGEPLSEKELMQAFRSAEAFAATEVQCDIPLTSWAEIAGLDDIKRMMCETLSWALFQYDKFALAGVRPPQSILLSGGQGTGKTSFVRALASHMPLHFIEVACPMLATRPLNESLRYLRACFSMAKRKAPCLVFLDDLDVLFDLAGNASGDQSLYQYPLVALLAAELDELSSLLGVVVIAATNRPDRLASDMLRPGRFDFVMTLPMPDNVARKKVIQIHARKLPLAADVDFERLAAHTQGMSPADIAALCNRVGLMALRQTLNSPEMAGFLPVVTADLFEQALRGRKS
ncbi:MAG: AAA family ATPase [Alphaproteobacteria bacterium]|nr:AAA family ATPase [Alphaproteobacteria bacterium]